MNVVVDSSVVMKWFASEAASPAARALLGKGDLLHAPEFMLTEIANIAWRKVITKDLTQTQAGDIIKTCMLGRPVLHPTQAFTLRALELAVAFNHPVYDCLYIACAERVGDSLVTADKKLRDKFAKHPIGKRIFLVQDWIGKIIELSLSPPAIFRILALVKDTNQTANHVRDSLPRRKGTLHFVSSEDLAPYFNSPLFHRLKATIKALSQEQKADLLALSWLGSAESNWLEARARAGDLIQRQEDHIQDYLISKLIYLEEGLAKLTLQQPP